MKIIDTEKIPIKIWSDDLEYDCMIQAKNLANLPFAFSHIAIMPDAHVGYGMPIGGVLATKDVIIPNAVGVDIGCGMLCVKTNLQTISIPRLKNIMSQIRNTIPMGMKHNKKSQDVNLMPKYKNINDYHIVNREWNSALKQIGTLGGGNHFIEIQKGSDDYIWIMIHSGSRNLGKKVADYYNFLAKKLNLKDKIQIPREYDLAFLYIESAEGQSYIKEMNYCVEFAYANRILMMNKILDIFKNEFSDFQFGNFVNIAHNYAKMELHFGKNVMIHRKGATLADKNTIGIIPGSQGSKSYLVKGLGNSDSFNSCSHGAGRVLGRKEACRKLNLEKEISSLEQKGIIHSIRHIRDLEEAPSAYKNIDVVMQNQKDLVEVLLEFSPLAVIKN